MPDLDARLGKAVAYFWNVRDAQGGKQSDSSGRGKVTGGRHCDGFAHLIKELLIESGIPDAMVFHKGRTRGLDAEPIQQKDLKSQAEVRRGTEVPGFFRATKDWDLVAVVDDQLIATVEFKSQVGPSFGNNVNNRAEESLGNAVDLWTAYREGAFAPSARPWLGYFMLLEEATASTTPVSVRQPHFKVFSEFLNASYAKRYELLCQRLVRERLYNGACLVLSDAKRGIKGGFREPNTEVGFRAFAASLMGHAMAFAKTRRE
ncbi:MAG TPA: PaeR7I family type II restriction endonuclease [Vicinamibacterales bacterium]|nr:PaeR7I family type II restriction endonuclease [Vicinamibacterales bacterium]